MLSADVTSDSPVSDFLGIRHHLLLKSAQEEQDELLSIFRICGEILEHNFQTARFYWEAASTRKQPQTDEICSFDTSALDVIYGRLIGRAWRVLPIDGAMEVLNVERRRFQAMNDYLKILMTNPEGPLTNAFFELVENAEKHRPKFRKSWAKILRSIETISLKLVMNPDVNRPRAAAKPRSSRPVR